MKILMTMDSLARGGRERRMIELLKGLKKSPEFQVVLIFFSDLIAYPEIYDLKYDIHLLKRKPKKDPRIFFKFFNICKAFGPDIIHSWGSMSSIYAIPSSIILNIKLINGNIVDAPNDLSIFDKRLLMAKVTYPFSDIIIGNSRAGLKAYQAPTDKSLCIYNGIDEDRIKILTSPAEVKKRYKIKENQKVIGMVGAFHDRKDFVTFIHAAIECINQRLDAVFIGIGAGPNLEACRNLIPIEYADRIILPGQIIDIENVINIFDIGILTTNSKVHGEGISNVIVEYMALAKPVIATNGGGTPEIVIEDQTGFLIEPHSVTQLVDKILLLLANPKMGVELGALGRIRIQERFSLEKMKAKYENLYKKLVSQSKLNLTSL